MARLPRGWSGIAVVPDNFHCWGVLLIWIKVGQGPAALAIGAVGGGGEGGWTFFSLVYLISLWENGPIYVGWLVGLGLTAL